MLFRSRFQQCDEVGFRGLGFEYRRVDYVYVCFAACLIHSRIHTRKNKFTFRIGLVRRRLSDENFRFGIGIGFGEFDGGVESVFELVARSSDKVYVGTLWGREEVWLRGFRAYFQSRKGIGCARVQLAVLRQLGSDCEIAYINGYAFGS